ncbi:hypothetical protein [Canibacter zhoujuaniae]|uniref:hypothetical protein n=1 Tax=Canibacter zhoujuaniae TaxID=2708343 RepID=UPI001422AAB3|nr:hypothetical protein [Canibacter zhoujuaniae]
MHIRFKRLFSGASALALVMGGSILLGTTAATALETSDLPVYTPEQPQFTREQINPEFRSEYHYAPVFQPVENQCSNVLQGHWARVTCWTDDGDNLIVRVEFLHRRGAVGAYIKEDTATQNDGGENRRFDGRIKKFYPIPAENRTADGRPYLIFSMKYWESEDFYIEAVDNLGKTYADYLVRVTQNVNRESDADPVVARQAVTYDKSFYKLSQPLRFEKYEVVDGQLKAVYSMINADPAQADLLDKIEIWPVSAETYTWRPENTDGLWRPYVEVPTRPLGCDARNLDVPRVSKIAAAEAPGLEILTYSKDSAEYPLVRDGAKTSIYVDVKPGWERLQYETWSIGCSNSFGRPGQIRPYQGQVTMPEVSLLSVTKDLGPEAAAAVAKTQEFGGTVSYPAGTYTQQFANTTGWQGLDWSGRRAYSYEGASYDWATTGGGTWNAPIMPAEATVTVTENAVAKPKFATWESAVPDAQPLVATSAALAVNHAGAARTAQNTANTFGDLPNCAPGTPALPQAGWETGNHPDTALYTNARVGNEITWQGCVPTPPKPPVVDECGPDNAAYTLPENTEDLTWELSDDGSITATVAAGKSFADGTTRIVYEAPVDSNVSCDDDSVTPPDDSTTSPEPPATPQDPPATPEKPTTPENSKAPVKVKAKKTLAETGSSNTAILWTSVLLLGSGLAMITVKRRSN